MMPQLLNVLSIPRLPMTPYGMANVGFALACQDTPVGPRLCLLRVMDGVRYNLSAKQSHWWHGLEDNA